MRIGGGRGILAQVFLPKGFEQPIGADRRLGLDGIAQRRASWGRRLHADPTQEAIQRIDALQPLMD